MPHRHPLIRLSRLAKLASLAAAVLLASCAAPPPKPVAPPAPPPAPVAPPVVVAPAAVARVKLPTITTPVGRLVPVEWAELPDFDTDPLDDVARAFKFSCNYLGKQPQWQLSCSALARLAANDTVGLRALLKTMQPYRAESETGDATGPITGYYEPVLRGSRVARSPYTYPLYSKPADLLTLDGKANGGITRGRNVGGKVVPYFSRAQMAAPEGQRSMSGREIVWVDDPMDIVLIEVQGSGRVMLPDGTGLRLNYAEHNGHPFKPLGNWFRDNTTLKNMTITQISQWSRANSPEKVLPMIHSNPQVVFFRSSPVTDVTVGPPGAAGAPLIPLRSIAVDPRSIPLAAPVWLEFKSPLSDVMYRRLVFAQDTGGAIKGAVRADYFWGFGQQAGEIAARTRANAGRMWVILPKP